MTGMGSAALAAAVPYPGKATEFAAMDNEELKNMFLSSPWRGAGELYHGRELLQVSFLSQKQTNKKRLSPRLKYACRDKTIVATNVFLSG